MQAPQGIFFRWTREYSAGGTYFRPDRAKPDGVLYSPPHIRVSPPSGRDTYFRPDRAKPSTVPHSPPMMWVSWEMLSFTKMASHSSPPR